MTTATPTTADRRAAPIRLEYHRLEVVWTWRCLPCRIVWELTGYRCLTRADAIETIDDHLVGKDHRIAVAAHMLALSGPPR